MEAERLKQLWEQILTAIVQRSKRSKFVTWFKNTALLRLDGTTAIIGAPNPFTHETLVREYRDITQEEVRKLLPEVEKIEFVVDGSLHAKDSRIVNVDKIGEEHKRKTDTAREVTLVEGLSTKVLNPDYTLDNFVIGPDNQLAHAAAVAVARKPGHAYNPLFVYGGVGLGKTHLLQAVGNEILKKNSKKKIIYVTSERFTNEVITAIRSRKNEQLRETYRQVDLLIIDDIQFLEHKEQTQVEFFHTFNTLYEAKKQIIISSDRPPQDLDSLEPRLRSRFEWGMMVDIGFPDFETRVAILQTKCQQKGIFISQDVLSFIASNVTESVRELEGVLHQATGLYELRHITPTIKTVAPMLQKLHPGKPLIGISNQQPGRNANGAQNIESLVKNVADYYKLFVEDLLGENRRADISLARQVAMFLAKKHLGLTYQAIGAYFSGRNHTTVMHACEKVATEMEKNQTLKRDTNALLHEMGVL